MSNKSLSIRILTIGVVSLTTFSCTQHDAVIHDSTPPTPWDGEFEYGPYTVGFRTSIFERTGSEGLREVALSVWYPADADTDSSKEMYVADYFHSAVNEGQLSETVGLSEEAAFAVAMTGVPTALSPERAQAGLATSVAARTGARTADGVFPVVLWSTRHATIIAQAPLAEVLASHGFVVATAWSSAPPLAFLWEDRTVADKKATIEAHTEDLVRALEVVRQDALVDSDNIVVLAWSYGGQTAARLQEREPAVRGVIALDANVVPARPEESLDLKRPLVFMVGRKTSGRGFERLQDLTAPWISLRFPELAHGNFNALEGYLPSTLAADTVYSWSSGGKIARDGYHSLAKVTTSAVLALSSEEMPAIDRVAANLVEAADSTLVEMTSFDPNLDH